MKKEGEDKIKRDILKSGFPLEISTSIALNKDKWHVVNNSRFYNDNKKNYSEIDIIASKKNNKFTNVSNVLIIECKKYEEGEWVFFRQDNTPINVFNLNIAESGKKISSYNWFNQNMIKNHFYSKNPLCTYYIVPHSKGKGELNEKKANMIYNAITQVVDALIFYLNRDSEILGKNNINEISILYPVIVFDGNLYSASVENDNVNLFEEKMVQLKYSLQLKEPMEIPWDLKNRKIIKQKDIIINVVKKEYLKEFLDNFE
jgi:hypothetical protein